jgi:histone-lysine N-methyltransferase SETMAR
MHIQYDSKIKHQSMRWTSKSSTRPKMFHLQKSRIKTMLITFFDKQVVIHKQVVSEGHRVNNAFYVIGRTSQLREQFRAQRSWFLLYDNALFHSALVGKIFLAKHDAVEISHPPYSPDLAPVIFFSLSYDKNCPQRNEVSGC